MIEGIEITIGDKAYPFPSSIDEVKLSNYLGFQKYAEQYSDLIEKSEKLSDAKYMDAYYKMQTVKAKAVCEFFGASPKELKIKREDTATEAIIDIIYVGILDLLATYKPKFYEADKKDSEELRFTHKGEEFVIIDGRGRDISVAEYISAREVERLMDNYRKSKRVSDSDVTYTEAVSLVAIFARREGDVLPENERDEELFIEGRKKFFADIPFAVGLDAIFFLGGLMRLFSGRLD